MKKLVSWIWLSVVLISACTTAQTPTDAPPTATEEATSPLETPALTSPLESPVELPKENSGEAIAAALEQDVAAELNVDVETLRLISVESVQWPDASLGCPQPGMVYAQVITPGWHLIFADSAGNEYDVRVPKQGDAFIICEQGAESMPQPIEEGAEKDVIAAAKRTVAEQKNISEASLSVEELESVEWRNSCLGCAGPDELCAMVITPGYRVVLKAGDARYEVHTDQDGGAARLCEGAGGKPVPPPSLDEVSDNVWDMHRTVLAFLNEHDPGLGLDLLPPNWQAQNVTEPEKLGASQYQLTNSGWELRYNCPVVAEPQCDVTLLHLEHGRFWQGQVDGAGEVLDESERLSLSYEVGECDESLTGAALEEWSGAAITSTLEGFDFVHRIPYVCCADIVASVMFDPELSTLRIIEANRGEVCRCNCGYEMRGRVTGLTEGEYAVEFWGVQKPEIHPLTLATRVEVEIP